MPDEFHKHIHQALNNPNLQSALDANAERRLSAREAAYASLPQPWVDMRQRAHDLRLGVVDHLPELTECFVRQAEKGGFTVHRAGTALEAVAIVRQVAVHHQVHLVAKSKTMVSEEIGLNHALELEGIRVVETDLGEYIVQLRGERPAHIITPAVHLSRSEVGDTFHEKLGVPKSDNVATLTAVARQHLRQVFLDADLGISGVNFGIVESGSLCILTNEGNGRMVTTLPRVHIALLGAERLVPTWADLVLMLHLLPRAATGQKLTVYTNLIHGPRKPGESDGPVERHIILIDNGRSAMRSSSLKEALMCIRCGACLNACPVFREIGGHAYVNQQGQSSPYPGPIGAVVSPGLFGRADYGRLARASSLCGACREACPVDIDLPKLLLRIRAGQISPTPNQPQQDPTESLDESSPPRPEWGKPNAPFSLSWGLRLFTWAARSSHRFLAVQRLVGLLSRPFTQREGWLHLPALTGWGTSKDLPRPANHPFRDLWAKRVQPADTATSLIQESNHGLISSNNTAVRSSDLAKDPEMLRQRFVKELETLGGHVVSGTTNDLAERLLAFLNRRGLSSLQSWSSTQLPAGLLDALQAAGVKITSDPDPEIPAGLTGAVGACADCGSLLLTAGAGRPLTASLLPQVHLAVLSKQHIYSHLEEILALEAVRQASCAVLVTGPSRTADIEMTLTIGVHGPGELWVFEFD